LAPQARVVPLVTVAEKGIDAFLPGRRPRTQEAFPMIIPPGGGRGLFGGTQTYRAADPPAGTRLRVRPRRWGFCARTLFDRGVTQRSLGAASLSRSPDGARGCVSLRCF
jgi:hypothetical protein